MDIIRKSMRNSKALSDLYPWISDIKSGETWESFEAVNKGWSSDEKYHIRTSSGEHLLLRISGMVTRAERAFADFDCFKRVIPVWYEKPV